MKELATKLQKVLDQFTADGRECGCQLSVYQDGDCLVDICSGWTTPERETAVTCESLFPVYSTGKGVFHTACHRLVEKGILSYDTRIGDIWPEFDNHGKEKITLWQVMAHQTGLHRTPEVTDDQMADWEFMTQLMAQATPEWTPGSRFGYQGLTLAWTMGEPMVRATGKPLRQILLDEVLSPLHLENDYYFGTDESAEKRLVPVDLSALPLARDIGRRDKSQAIHRACLPSFNGYATARAVAKMYAALDREMDGVRLLKPETLDRILHCTLPPDDPEYQLAMGCRMSLGYVLIGPKGNLSRMFGHGGALGAEGFLDRERHLAVGFAKNKPLPTSPIHAVRDAISEILEEPKRYW